MRRTRCTCYLHMCDLVCVGCAVCWLAAYCIWTYLPLSIAAIAASRLWKAGGCGCCVTRVSCEVCLLCVGYAVRGGSGLCLCLKIIRCAVRVRGNRQPATGNRQRQRQRPTANGQRHCNRDLQSTTGWVLSAEQTTSRDGMYMLIIDAVIDAIINNRTLISYIAIAPFRLSADCRQLPNSRVSFLGLRTLSVPPCIHNPQRL
jgi:hypothetical protein